MSIGNVDHDELADITPEMIEGADQMLRGHIVPMRQTQRGRHKRPKQGKITALWGRLRKGEAA